MNSMKAFVDNQTKLKELKNIKENNNNQIESKKKLYFETFNNTNK